MQLHSFASVTPHGDRNMALAAELERRIDGAAAAAAQIDTAEARRIVAEARRMAAESRRVALEARRVAAETAEEIRQIAELHTTNHTAGG